MTKSLFLMRHAKSDWKQPGLPDHDRPLNARGRKAAPLMAAKLSERGVHVDVILASTAVRAQETVALLREFWSSSAEVLNVPALYLASPQTILAEVQSLHDSWHSAMVVGHNPGLSILASQLAGQELDMPTAAVVHLLFHSDSWQALRSHAPPVLCAYWKPRELAD